ncbi:hypothetical protein SAMN04488561_3570 [Jiangella alba]|uniref:Uncharacterized protein n=2 Tax=Jiangella alba TaxID=561176 RepID=A0A1H5MZC6_9ACTN|nr:hypothetical protein SAMN04488561_3570 [Jiangella alba]
MSDHLRVACSWLWAAERHTGDRDSDVDLRARLIAGEALDILTDVTPPHPPPDDDREPTPLAIALPHTLSALAAATAATGITAEARLRIARAVRVLTDGRPR